MNYIEIVGRAKSEVFSFSSERKKTSEECLFLHLLLSVPQCFGKLDIIFVLDVTLSVDMTSTRSLISEMIDKFNQSIPGNVRTGVVFYEGPVFHDSTIQLNSNLKEAKKELWQFDKVKIRFERYFIRDAQMKRESALSSKMSIVARKFVLWVPDQVKHQPGCAAIEAS